MILKHAYSGSPHVRIISAYDMNSQGVEGHLKTEWSPANNHTAEVSDEVGQWLLDHEVDDWEQVEPEVISANEGVLTDESEKSGDAPETPGDASPESTSPSRPRRSR